MSDQEILCDFRNHVAFITLNRPTALNALSLGMVVELTRAFRRCAADPAVRAVMLRGAGEKAFCAGGDIRALYDSFKTSGSLHHEFFALEYPLDYLLYSYPKPYLVLMNGITMGGGMGLAQGSTLRVVGERTRIAMPEVGIGLFPDVGGSYFLSRLPGHLGIYLALTGAQVRGPDAVYCGLADFYMGAAGTTALADDLANLKWSDDAAADVRALLASRAEREMPVPPLSALRGIIDEHFSRDSVPAILASLDHEVRPEHAEWARQTVSLLRTRSPTMLMVTLRQLQLGRTLSLADCFRMELGMVEQCFEQGDFVEGVRALIIDKDGSPHWDPSHLNDVTAASLDAFFRDRWHGANHPLATLEGTVLHA